MEECPCHSSKASLYCDHGNYIGDDVYAAKDIVPIGDESKNHYSNASQTQEGEDDRCRYVFKLPIPFLISPEVSEESVNDRPSYKEPEHPVHIVCNRQNDDEEKTEQGTENKESQDKVILEWQYALVRTQYFFFLLAPFFCDCFVTTSRKYAAASSSLSKIF